MEKLKLDPNTLDIQDILEKLEAWNIGLATSKNAKRRIKKKYINKKNYLKRQIKDK